MTGNDIQHNSDTLRLSDRAVKLFDNFKNEKSYKKNTLLYLQGEQAEYFYYLKKGSVKIFVNSVDGLQKTISIVNDGSILGEASFFDRMPRISSAQTITPCTIVRITHEQLEKEFVRNPELAMYLLKVQAQSIRMLSMQVSGIIFTKADCRIAKQLLNSRKDINGIPTVQLTHEELGNLVGVSRVTVSKILNDFVARNIVRTAYRYVIITDIKKLEEIAYHDDEEK